MSATLAKITFYLIIVVGYVWAVVEFIAGNPFDAFVLFIVTFSYNTYRNTIVKEARQQ